MKSLIKDIEMPTGGIGEAIALMGLMSSMGGAKSPKSVDLRSGAEREAADRAAQESISRANYFSRLRETPDFGYPEERGRGFELAYSRARRELPERLAGTYADLGFGPRGVGPQAAGTARELSRLEESQASQEAQDRAAWRQYVESSGTANLPAVPGTGAGIFTERQPSPFAQLIGPVAGAVGQRVGQRIPLPFLEGSQ
jgi:hypothetical protein